MNTYNLYFKNTRINNVPLTYKEVRKMLSYNVIYKKINDDSIIEIPTKKLRIVQCVMI